MPRVVEMATEIPATDWRIQNGKLYALCPWCSQRQVIENEIVDGFTEGMIICRMPSCGRLDYVRLLGWPGE